jgi:uncharacterized protein with WD repeat
LCDLIVLMAYLRTRHFYLVAEAHYEGASFYLIDDRSGRKTVIGAPPVFSPDGQHFLVQNDNMTNEHDNNLEIWRLQGDTAAIEWSHSLAEAKKEVPGPVLYHTEVADWRGDRIRLAFQAGRHLETGNQIIADREWSGSLTKMSDGWHLQADWPNADELDRSLVKCLAQ